MTAYEEAIARLPKEAGLCAQCNEELVVFAAPPLDDNVPPEEFERQVRERRSYGCPEHDVHVIDWMNGKAAWCAVLQDPADPFWSWAPEDWRPTVAKYGIGLPNTLMKLRGAPRLHVGLREGRVWVTDMRNLFVLPEGSTLAQVEDCVGVQVYGGKEVGYKLDPAATAKRREELRLSPKQLAYVDRPEGLGGEHKLPSEMGLPKSWDESNVAVNGVITPRWLFTVFGAFYQGVVWRAVPGDHPRIFGEVDGEVVVVASPLDVDRKLKEEAEAREHDVAAEAHARGKCTACGHQHADDDLDWICVGCPCPHKGGAPLEAPAPEEAVPEATEGPIDAAALVGLSPMLRALAQLARIHGRPSNEDAIAEAHKLARVFSSPAVDVPFDGELMRNLIDEVSDAGGPQHSVLRALHRIYWGAERGQERDAVVAELAKYMGEKAARDAAAWGS